MHFYVRDGRAEKDLMMAAERIRLKGVAQPFHFLFQFGKTAFFVQDVQIPHQAEVGFRIEIFRVQSFQGQKAQTFGGERFADLLPCPKLLHIRVNADVVRLFPCGSRFFVGRGRQKGQSAAGHRREGMFVGKEEKVLPFDVVRFVGQRFFRKPRARADETEKIFAGMRQPFFGHRISFWLCFRRNRQKFQNFSVADAQNFIGDVQRGGAVGDDEAGFPLFPTEIFEQPFFRLPVERGSCFVEQEHRAFGQEGTGDGEPLELPFRQPSAPLFEKGV